MHGSVDRPIGRAEIIERARFWVDNAVHYLDQDGSEWPETAPDPQGRLYRADCSGFVAMAWRAGHEPDTSDFGELGYEIGKDDLLPGDAVLWKGVGGYGGDGGHVLLFDSWLDEARTRYRGYELSGGCFTRHHEQAYPHRKGDRGYLPWRRHSVS